MDKIKLPEECKALLYYMSDKTHIEPEHNVESDKWLEVLEYYELVTGVKNEQGHFIIAELTPKARVYMLENPKLKDPSFWDDKHALVDHVINIIGAIIP